MDRHSSIALTGLLVALTLGAHVPAIPAATEAVSLDASLALTETTSDSIVLVGNTTVGGPSEPSSVVEPIISEAATVDLGVEPPFEFRYRASPVLSDVSRAGLYHRAGVGHTAWLYGALAPGSTVIGGDRRQSVVVGSTPYPAYPPRPVEPDGHLEWAPTTPHAVTVEARVTDPDSGEVWTQTLDAVSITTTLRAVEGGVVAPDGMEAPVLRVPLPGYNSGSIATTRLAGVPGIGPVTQTSQTVDDGNGGRMLEIRASLPPGSAWPESGDEAPGGTWGYRAHILAMDFSDATPADSGEPAEPAVHLSIGTLGPGQVLEVQPAEGPPTILRSVLGADLLVTERRARILAEEPLPLPPSGRSPVVRAEPPSTDAACGTDISTAGAGNRLGGGAVRADLEPDGTFENLCLSGAPIGAVGLPTVRVDGTPREPVWDGDRPRVSEYAFETGSGFYGNALIIQYAGTAGAVRFDIQVFLMNTDRGGILQPVVWDFHAPGTGAGTVQFDWLLDPDSGPDESFLAFGAAPLLTETILGMDGAGHILGAEPPHLVTGPASELVHEIRHFGPAGLVVHRRDSELPDPPVVEAAAVPPEPLVGADVALYVPTTLVGPHLYAYLNRAPLVNDVLGAIPPPAGGSVGVVLALAPVLAGQVGLAWGWLITGYDPV